MKTIKLTEQDVTFVRGALELARDKYLENVTILNVTPGCERLAEQFRRQFSNYERLLDVIER